MDYNSSSWLNTTERQQMLLEGDQNVLPPSCCLEESMVDLPQTECLARLDDVFVFNKGCFEPIFHFFQSSVDLLSVLGFCVITFIKMCFLCLLRYEIKEMIEKIKVIKGQTSPHMLPFQDLEVYLPRPSIQQDALLNVNSSTTTGTCSHIPRTSNAISEKCHCRLGVMTNLTSTLSGSRMILSTSTANLSGSQSKKHSLV